MSDPSTVNRPGFWSGVASTVARWFGRGRRGEKLTYLRVDEIQDHPLQPREYVLDEHLQSLKSSIERYGVIVPIIVSRVAGRYQLVAGQRRLAAVRALGYARIPAIVRQLTLKEMMEAAYLENLHRLDLSKVDHVLMFDRIRRKHPGLSEEELAATMGLEADEIRRARGFLDLPVPVQEALRAGMIGEEHANAISELSDPDDQLEVIEMVWQHKIGGDETRTLVDRMRRKDAPYVASDDGVHFHAPSCAFAKLIPDGRRVSFWTAKEPAKRGKIACLNCL